MRGLAVALMLVALVTASAAAAAAATAPQGADAADGVARCGNVPCGYIYPLIVIEAEGARDGKPLPKEGEVVMDATLTFKFDAANEGFTANDPTKPIEITFEFPRKPGWADIQVEPNIIQVPISPQYLQPDASDPSSAEVWYEWSTDITITFAQKDTPVLEAGRDYAKLLVFAKSSESGLYKPSYGIKEFRLTPEGAVVASDDGAVADYVDPAPQAVDALTRSLGDARLTLTPLEDVSYFRPTPTHLAVTNAQGEPVPEATLSLSLVDEAGRLLYATGPRKVYNGHLFTNLTFPEPGLYKVVATSEPAPNAATKWPAASVAFNVRLGPADAAAVRLSPEYRATYHEAVTEVAADGQDPARQYDKRIPFPVYPGANAAAFAFFLGTQAPAPGAQGPTGAANLNVEVLDPNGATLATGSFDPANPTLRLPVTGLPGPGLYHVRVSGAGLNGDASTGATYDVEMAVTYDGRPIIRDLHDGAFDPVASASHAGLTVTPASAALEPWTPVTPTLELTTGDGAPLQGDAEALVTITDAAGRLVHTTGWQSVEGGAVDAPVTFPGGGLFYAHVTVETTPGDGEHWQPTTLTVPLTVGDITQPTFTYPTEYVAQYAESAPLLALPGAPGGPGYAKAYPVPVLSGAERVEATVTPGDASATFTVELVDGDGNVVDSAEASGAAATVAADAPAAGDYEVRVRGYNAAGAAYDVEVRAAYATAPTAPNPLHVATGSDPTDVGGSLTPAPAPVWLLALIATAALAARGAARRR